MKVFVTGATGFVGTAVVQELLKHGHQVWGLARSEEGASKLRAVGAEVLMGTVEDLSALKKGVDATEGTIHTAFIHDFSKFEENCKIDHRAVLAMGEALKGTKKPLVVTSGTAIIAFQKPATEDVFVDPSKTHNPRVASELAVGELRKQGLNATVMRLPPSVHGEGDHGFIPLLINLAKEKGAVAYIHEGANVWPAVSRFDAANLYRLAIESKTLLPHYHAIGEEGVAFKKIAECMSKHLNLPLKKLTTQDEINQHFTWFAHFASIDNPTSAARSREATGWKPTHPRLIEDMEHAKYFA